MSTTKVKRLTITVMCPKCLGGKVKSAKGRCTRCWDKGTIEKIKTS